MTQINMSTKKNRHTENRLVLAKGKGREWGELAVLPVLTVLTAML